MAFYYLNPAGLRYKIEAQVFRNPEPRGTKYRIYDHRPLPPYPFNCPVCKKSSLDIKMDDIEIAGQRPVMNTPIVYTLDHGGFGTLQHVIFCTTCASIYHIALGYSEPNNGRDVWTLSAIYRLSEVHEGDDYDLEFTDPYK